MYIVFYRYFTEFHVYTVFILINRNIFLRLEKTKKKKMYAAGIDRSVQLISLTGRVELVKTPTSPAHPDTTEVKMFKKLKKKKEKKERERVMIKWGARNFFSKSFCCPGHTALPFVWKILRMNLLLLKEILA